MTLAQLMGCSTHQQADGAKMRLALHRDRLHAQGATVRGPAGESDFADEHECQNHEKDAFEWMTRYLDVAFGSERIEAGLEVNCLCGSELLLFLV